MNRGKRQYALYFVGDLREELLIAAAHLGRGGVATSAHLPSSKLAPLAARLLSEGAAAQMLERGECVVPLPNDALPPEAAVSLVTHARAILRAHACARFAREEASPTLKVLWLTQSLRLAWFATAACQPVGSQIVAPPTIYNNMKNCMHF